MGDYLNLRECQFKMSVNLRRKVWLYLICWSESLANSTLHTANYYVLILNLICFFESCLFSRQN